MGLCWVKNKLCCLNISEKCIPSARLSIQILQYIFEKKSLDTSIEKKIAQTAISYEGTCVTKLTANPA
jgi:hypothetical protein